jgi:glutamate-1-semialdehyde 2,1-aminomutase
MKTQPDRILEALVARHRERTSRSAAHHLRCLGVSPAGVNSSLRAWEPHPLYFTLSEAARICDLDGNEHLDCAATQGVLEVGHRNPIVLDAVRRQVDRITVVGASHPPGGELCELILKRYPCHDRVRLTNTGPEAG